MSKRFLVNLEVSVPEGVSREQVMYYFQNITAFTSDIRSVQQLKVNRIIEEKQSGGTRIS
jgi:hypothetical protein